MERKIAAAFLAAMMVTGMTGCSTADVVNHNLSKDATEFNLYRRITVTNARTDTIMLRAEGYMDLSNNSSNELVVTIRTGEGTYYKDYIYLNDWTCYVMEQTEPTSTDKYHYELVFYPERIIPDIETK
nr:MAG TPA: transmembrane cytochrome C oxidase subunit [Caudoviricetes sp.]